MEILFEDNHLIIVNKLPSEIVQGDKTGDRPLSEKVSLYIKEKYHKPGDAFIGVPHRIDRPVSGVVIFARTSKALSRMSELFRSKEVRKIYWAVVKDKPAANEATLVHYLLRNEKANKSKAVPEGTKDALRAELTYRVHCSSDRYHLLEIQLHTGRHHQIRAQLSAIGCPIKGDIKYGSKRTNDNASIHLHARKVEFIHPVSKETVSVTADPPDDPLWNYFRDQMKTAS